ncbi:Uncharacterized protein SCF082_LOCUS31538 [Durusdinium trenchii]|uniref:Uncharacterized protein n=1 Tax=Durusdinium trenchii TaxID=1381693 RepID=A0ABP0N838_9DINO
MTAMMAEPVGLAHVKMEDGDAKGIEVKVKQEMNRLFAMSCVNKHVDALQSTIQSVPATTKKNFLLDPWAFNFSEHSKYGECGRFPSNHQFLAHYGSFLQHGFESHREAFEVKFGLGHGSDPFKIEPFSVGFVDGQCKALIIQTILALISKMVSAEDDLDEPMAKVIASFRYCRANFHKHEEPETFLFESLCVESDGPTIFAAKYEPCQHLAGESIVESVVTGLLNGTSSESSVVILDMLGYDGKRFACGTACHTVHETSFVSSLVAQKVYAMARAGELRLPAFPNFSNVVSELSAKQELPAPNYEVCVGLANGTLVLKQNLVSYWSKCSVHGDDFQALLKAHNEKYNPRGVKRGGPGNEHDDDGAEGSVQATRKKLKVESSVKAKDQEEKFDEPLALSCGNYRLIYDKGQDTLWLGAEDPKKKDVESIEVSGPCELFGFGSGDFAEGPEAADIMSDVTGRWLCYKVTSCTDECILEVDKRLPDHIRKSDVFGKALHVLDMKLWGTPVLVVTTSCLCC